MRMLGFIAPNCGDEPVEPDAEEDSDEKLPLRLLAAEEAAEDAAELGVLVRSASSAVGEAERDCSAISSVLASDGSSSCSIFFSSSGSFKDADAGRLKPGGGTT